MIGSAAVLIDAWLALLIASCLKLSVWLSFLCNNGMTRMGDGDLEMAPKAAGQDGISTPASQILVSA